MKLTILGSGTSTGVPLVGCSCAVCLSTDTKNHRSRASVLIQDKDFSVLVDTGPDLRRQMLRHEVSSLDQVLYTHYHYDHIGGLNDLRPFCFHKESSFTLSCLANEQTYNEIKRLYPYVFAKDNANTKKVKKYPQQVKLDFKVFSFNQQEVYNPFQTGRLSVQPIRLMHIPGINMECVGFVFNQRIGYLTDFKYIYSEYDSFLYDLDVLILGSPIHREHPSHISIPEAIELIQKYKPNQGVISHLSHENSHTELEDEFPEQISPAYDGMSFDLSDAPSSGISAEHQLQTGQFH